MRLSQAEIPKKLKQSWIKSQNQPRLEVKTCWDWPSKPLNWDAQLEKSHLPSRKYVADTRQATASSEVRIQKKAWRIQATRGETNTPQLWRLSRSFPRKKAETQGFWLLKWARMVMTEVPKSSLQVSQISDTTWMLAHSSQHRLKSPARQSTTMSISWALALLLQAIWLSSRLWRRSWRSLVATTLSWSWAE